MGIGIQMHGITLKIKLKEFAHAIGIVHLGVTNAVPAKDYKYFIEWTEKGCAGDMWYLTESVRKGKRESVQHVFPEAKTVLVAAASYKPKENRHPTDAKFARYGWGEDYHHFVKKKLDQIVKWLEVETKQKIKSRTYVDTGPILEKNIAETAGVGWMGKNTCLIHPKFGSYIYIGEILTDLEIESDAPATHHCGTCTKCLDACPTNAFIAPYKMDATKCISYHTIESKDSSMPKEISDNLNGYVAGCDICQEVCPWNNKSPASEIPEVQPGEHVKLTLEKILSLSETDHAKLFSKSSFRRIPLDKLKANARAVKSYRKLKVT